VSVSAVSTPADPEARVSTTRLVRAASLVFCGVLPVIVVGLVFVGAVQDSAVATDFTQFYRAAQAILHAQNPYGADQPVAAWGGPYPYPPLPALGAVVLTALSLQVAGLLVMGVLVAVALATLAVLDVRDWRCYGVVLLWPPVINAIQTGNVTLWFALAAALAWRFRDRLLAPAAAIGVTLAAKFFLWPLSVWLAATRRWAAAALSLALGAALLVVSWAVIGFDGFLGYPALLRRLEHVVGRDSYTTYVVGLELGVPSVASRALWLALGFAVLATVVVVARRGDQRSAFVLALGATLALTPIVWLHYFALLLVVVALARPTLGVLWFVPLAMIVTPGSGHPTLFESSATLVVAAVTTTLALRSTLGSNPGDASPQAEPA